MNTSRRIVFVLALLVGLGALAACDSGSGPSDGTPNGAGADANPPAAGGGTWCPSSTFVGDLQGVQATVTAQFSVSPNFHAASGTFDGKYIQMGGELVSPNAYYVFYADLYPYAGYGDMIDGASGESFRIYVELKADGFWLVSNPFEGLYSTTYEFLCAP